MQIPVIHGVIRRRLLLNYRVEPDVLARIVPHPFQPKLHNGFGIAGICLIRLEQIRPVGVPAMLGLSSENAAHRMAVTWNDPESGDQEGVYIPRRDTGSRLNQISGGRIFSGEYHLADFQVADDGHQVAMSINSRDGKMAIQLNGTTGNALPADSCFRSLEEASTFFEAGSIGYSATRDCCRLDGLRLETKSWKVQPFIVDDVSSTFFADQSLFPAGSLSFDHALIMRDLPHSWHQESPLITEAP